jgi:hypothetical protein
MHENKMLIRHHKILKLIVAVDVSVVTRQPRCCNGYQEFFHVGKEVGAWKGPHHLYGVQECMELHLYSPPTVKPWCFIKHRASFIFTSYQKDLHHSRSRM